MAENKIELENIEVPMKRVGSVEEPDAKRPKQDEKMMVTTKLMKDAHYRRSSVMRLKI